MQPIHRALVARYAGDAMHLVVKEYLNLFMTDSDILVLRATNVPVFNWRRGRSSSEQSIWHVNIFIGFWHYAGRFRG